MSASGKAGIAVGLCILAAMCEGMDVQVAGVAAAGIAAQFSPTPEGLGTFFSSSTLGLLLGALAGGWMSDRHGRKTVLVVSVALFGVCSLLTAASQDILQLTWARLFTGFGLGGAMPNLLAMVSEESPDRSRHSNLTLVFAAMPVGGALISLIAMMIPAGHWRSLFVAGGFLPLIMAGLMARYLPESAEFNRKHQANIQSGGGADNRLGRIMGEGRALPSLLLWASFFLGLFILYLLLNWMPMLMMGRGMSSTGAAQTQIAFNAGGAIAAAGIGAFLGGARRLPAVGLTAFSMPLLFYLLAQSHAQAAGLFVIVLALGCAVQALLAFLYATAPLIYPVLTRGLGVGIAVAIGRLGAVVGPKLGGAWKAEGLDTSQLLMKVLPIVIMVSVGALALAFVTVRVSRVSPAEPPAEGPG